VAARLNRTPCAADTQGVTLLRRALPLLPLALLAAGAGSAATPIARIDVLDALIRPAQTRVDVGGRVVWTNRGRRTHVVTSPRALWRPLTLGPGRSREIRLKPKASGCERINVDGKTRGLLFIGVAACPASGSPGAGNRYDVRVVAFVEATRVTRGDPDPELNGTRRATVRWTSTWKNVQVGVLRPTSTTLMISANATGSIRGAFEFADRRPAWLCKGTTAINSPARLLITATRRPSGPTTFNLATFASDEIGPSFCPDDDTKLPFEAPEVTVQGLIVTTSDSNQGVSIERTGRAGVLFIPIEQLRDGLGFSVSTGGRSLSNHTCGYSFCTKTVRSEMRLTFTRAR
jgi:plastocyanin